MAQTNPNFLKEE